MGPKYGSLSECSEITGVHAGTMIRMVEGTYLDFSVNVGETK